MKKQTDNTFVKVVGVSSVYVGVAGNVAHVILRKKMCTLAVCLLSLALAARCPQTTLTQE